jgi:hypothetical protein
MFKTIMKGLFGLAASMTVVGTASAQNELVPSPNLYAMDRADFTSVLTGMSLKVQTFSPSGQATLIRAELANGNAFILEPLGCEDPVAIVGCPFFKLVVGFEPFAVPYARLNEYHQKVARLAAATKVGPNQGMVAAEVFTGEGMTKSSVQLHVALFLHDVDRFYTNYIAKQNLNQSVGLEPDFAPLFARSRGANRQEVSYGRIIDLTAPTIGQEEVSFMTSAAKKMIEESHQR